MNFTKILKEMSNTIMLLGFIAIIILISSGICYLLVPRQTNEYNYIIYDYIWKKDFNKDNIISKDEVMTGRSHFLKSQNWTADENWRTFKHGEKVTTKEFNKVLKEHYNLK